MINFPILQAISPFVPQAGGSGGGQQGTVAAAAMTCQEADFWCWAAVTQTVELCGSKQVDQADIATDHVSAGQPGVVCTSCDASDSNSQCASPCGGACNSPHILRLVLSERNRLSGPARNVSPSFQDVIDAVDADKPLPVRIALPSGGHFVCVVGYSDDGAGNRFVDVLDPLVPGVGQGFASLRSIPFSSFVGGLYNVNGESGSPNYIYDVIL